MRKKQRGMLLSWLLIFSMILSGISIQYVERAYAATESIVVKYGGKQYTVPKNKQTLAVVNGKKVSTSLPGMIMNGSNMVIAKVFKESSLGIKYSYDSKKKVATFQKDKNTIILTMGKRSAKVNGKTVTISTAPQRVYYAKKDTTYTVVPARFVAETLGFSYTWKNASRTCEIKNKVVPTTVPTVTPVPTSAPALTATPVPTAMPTPTSSGAVSGSSVTGGAVTTPKPTATPKPVKEVKAMWISYLEYGASAKTKSQFKSKMTKTFDNCVKYGMNTVIVQVRPYSDAMYESKYFPWSKYASGKQGKNPGYDPLKIMVSLAHERGLRIEAWINPYRITTGSTSASSLPDGHPAKNWMKSSDSSVKRRVISYGGNLYYNPSKEAVQTLIINGVKEIVKNYDVDGIHFDDYFYPQMGSSYKTVFDAKEYNTYVANKKKKGETPSTIVSWRRGNVNKLVKGVYSAVHSTKSNVVFGISPAGNINNLLSSSGYYANVKTWMSNKNYVDYICPQIYWSFKNKTCPYKATVDKWVALKTSNTVDLYIGIAAYRAGSSEEEEWKTSSTVLKRQVEYGRTKKAVSGFAFYRYDSFQASRSQKEVKNLVAVLKK